MAGGFPLFAGGLQALLGGAVGVLALHGGVPQGNGGGAVGLQALQRCHQLVQRFGVVVAGQRFLQLLHTRQRGGVTRLGVGGAAHGGKGLLFQHGHLLV